MEPRERIARLREGRVVVFVGCGKLKRRGRHRAEVLYLGQYFRRCRSLALYLTDRENVYILSAKYGVIHLDAEVDSYNLRVTDMSPDELEEWRKKVLAFVRDKQLDGFTPVYVCGEDYYQDLPGVKLIPRGLAIGEQLRLLKELLRGHSFGLIGD